MLVPTSSPALGDEAQTYLGTLPANASEAGMARDIGSPLTTILRLSPRAIWCDPSADVLVPVPFQYTVDPVRGRIGGNSQVVEQATLNSRTLPRSSSRPDLQVAPEGRVVSQENEMSHPNLQASPLNLTFQDYDLVVHTRWWADVICDLGVVFSFAGDKEDKHQIAATTFALDDPSPTPWQGATRVFTDLAKLSRDTRPNERPIIHVVQFHDNQRIAVCCFTAADQRIAGPLTIKERQAVEPK